MRLLSNYPRAATDALLLRESAYEESRDSDNPFVLGLVFVIVIGVSVAVADAMGNVLEWTSLPSLPAMRQLLWDSLIRGPWEGPLMDISGEMLATLRSVYDQGWRVYQLLAPSPWRSVVALITTPLGLTVMWLVYGLLAHIYSRLLGGEASLGQTYGCVAMAYSAQILRMVNVLPFVRVGGIVAVWGMVCRFVALKSAHKLSGGRAFWAAVLPTLTIWFVTLVLLIGMNLLIGSLVPDLVEGLTWAGGAP